MNANAKIHADLEDDDVLDDVELEKDRAEIEAAGAIYDRWRQRLAAIDARKE